MITENVPLFVARIDTSAAAALKLEASSAPFGPNSLNHGTRPLVATSPARTTMLSPALAVNVQMLLSPADEIEPRWVVPLVRTFGPGGEMAPRVRCNR